MILTKELMNNFLFSVATSDSHCLLYKEETALNNKNRFHMVHCSISYFHMVHLLLYSAVKIMVQLVTVSPSSEF
jgi:hypothetical protein